MHACLPPPSPLLYGAVWTHSWLVSIKFGTEIVCGNARHEIKLFFSFCSAAGPAALPVDTNTRRRATESLHHWSRKAYNWNHMNIETHRWMSNTKIQKYKNRDFHESHKIPLVNRAKTATIMATTHDTRHATNLFRFAYFWLNLIFAAWHGHARAAMPAAGTPSIDICDATDEWIQNSKSRPKRRNVECRTHADTVCVQNCNDLLFQRDFISINIWGHFSSLRWWLVHAVEASGKRQSANGAFPWPFFVSIFHFVAIFVFLFPTSEINYRFADSSIFDPEKQHFRRRKCSRPIGQSIKNWSRTPEEILVNSFLVWNDKWNDGWLRFVW